MRINENKKKKQSEIAYRMEEFSPNYLKLLVSKIYKELQNHIPRKNHPSIKGCIYWMDRLFSKEEKNGQKSHGKMFIITLKNI